MSYPLPPGVSSLPPRPPQSETRSQAQPAPRGGFKPFSASTRVPPQSAYPGTGANSSYSAQSSYASVTPPSYGQSRPPPPQGYGQRAPGQSMNTRPDQTLSYNQQPHSYGPQSYGASSSYGAPPNIQNPFQPPSAAVPGYDADEAAQIAQWQSTYASRDPTAAEPTKDGSKPAMTITTTTAATKAPLVETVPDDKKKTVIREGGGKKWQDDTLTEWDPSHLRLFVGNLAGETTDDSLLKAFARWKSVQKARVIRDKRTTKSKGYGFVSFSDADDFFQSAREMNGKYIQSHPVVVKKANTEIKVTTAKEDRRGGKKFGNKGKGDRRGNGSGAGRGGDGGAADSGGHEPGLGPMGNNGVVKPGQRTKSGLKLLG